MADALVRYDDAEAVFRKSLAERLWFGAILVVVTCLLGIATADAYKGGAAERDHLPLCFLMLFLFILILGFAAGPREVRFDFRQKRYRVKQGLLFFTWTLSGDFSDISHFAYWNSQGVTIEWKNKKRPQTMFTHCKTGREAKALAERLGVSAGLPVKDGYARGVRKSAR